MAEQDSGERVRLDKWLWAARFFKTRSLAGTAVAGGKVQVNDARAKRAKQLKVGDVVRVRKGPYEFVLTVRGLAERRGPATEAQKLYEESEDSRAAREEIAAARALERAQAPRPPLAKMLSKGRPTKKDRRTMARFKDKNSESS